ncbi:carboxypeptidase-like regulatory domain-containing protein [Winogradskyella eckloniae]|uniref:carboxypeptidase-like regulatory domain-containing protein n=1 Tax=Winogradskyella eckloniae TaxID=1089306 RepID=UPI0015636469|nr:carboxypeptidase-like regulatory domain-containing protein [Winogradskyella eckloniae]NRD20679.1 carboxypeptidase-like regulatory domain-containing protein [Winogradskyella eckloniae]
MHKLTVILILLMVSVHYVHSQEKTLKIEGVVKDETSLSIPFAAISITSKYLGTSSNEDGHFYLMLSQNNLLDTLEVSSIGFTTSKIVVKDFIALKEKVIVLKEDVVSLDEVNIMNPKQYVDLAFKKLKENMVSSVHELKILNRFFAVEDDIAKFYVEHYVKVKDVGPRGGKEVRKIDVVEGRQSVDFRSYKNPNMDRIYPINFMTKIDPLRRGINTSNYEWTKIGDTSYDGEDIVIIQGINQVEKRKKYLDPVLYIGIDTYKVYKTRNKAANVVYIYKKNKDGKLYLSYHNHYGKKFVELSEEHQKILKTTNDKIKISKRNEVVVLGIETDTKKIDVNYTNVHKMKMEEVKVKYNAQFWEDFNMPPPTEYYKKSIKELEASFGINIQTQFEYANK